MSTQSHAKVDKQVKEFFVKLDKHSGTLRHSAREMADYIAALPWKTEQLTALKNAYVDFIDVSLLDLEQAIHNIHTELMTIDFLSSTNNINDMNNADFVMLFDKQNHFIAEINILVKKALELVEHRV